METQEEKINRWHKEAEDWKRLYYEKNEQNAKLKSACEFALKYNAMRAEKGKREFPSQLVSAINKALGK